MRKKTLWSISEQENKADFGTLKIKNDVIATIASTAATEVEGVAKTGRNIFCGITGNLEKIFSKRGVYDRGAYVEFNEDNELRITLYVIAKYGTNLPNLASSVQAAVRSAIEKMTGIIPHEVNVIIQGVQPLK